ncbi:MAG: hypothetical protein QOJ53_780 [Sphingomonadales bacterium]|nr:hypothetical protein [Sphingomonadales bacterium]MEA3043902.1 hypothetical protein [Sphingomonadales bacterium]MEA3046448.1 hypothetical protein [Sphingomonadales bacterium]
MTPPFRFLLAALALAAAGKAAAQDGCTGPASALRFYVTVEGVRSSQGLIAVTLYADDSRRFLARRGSLYVGRVPARAGATRVCIHLPGPGTYALAVYHDADANRSLSRNMIGLPREGYGFSNNAPAIFGLPSFSRVRMNVPHTNMGTTIRLRYP